MTSTSERAGEIVRSLQLSTLAERLLGRTLDQAALAALEELKDASVAPYLVALALQCERTSARRVADVVGATMAAVAPTRLIQLDNENRTRWGVAGLDSMPWYSLKPRDIPRLSRIGSNARALLGVVSAHNNGRVRDAAVRQLDARETGDELPYLLLRLNDWVTPVAEAAKSAILRRVDARHARVWVQNLALVQWLATATRRPHDDVVAAVFKMLRDLESPSILMPAIMSPDATIRRLGYRLARNTERGDFVDLVRQALDDDDSAVRLEAIRAVREASYIDSLTPVVAKALTDTVMAVRREALLASVERQPGNAMTPVIAALLDRNPAIRELARFLATLNDATFSFVDFYRDGLRSGSTDAAIAAAVAGLGETGSATDVSLVIPHLSHQQPRVRREAVRALSRLDAVSHASTFVDLLSDVSPKVGRASRDVLQARAGMASYDAIVKVIRGAPHAHGKLNALTLVETLGKWPALVLLLRVAHDSDKELAVRARELLRQWVATANRRFTTPTTAQLSEISELLDQPFDGLADDLRAQMRGFVDPWRGEST